MIDWDTVILKDLCSEIKYGFTASSTEENTGVKFLRITDIASENLRWDTVPYCVITDSDYQKYKIEKNDVVIARTGATVGYAKIIREINDKAVFASYLIKLKFKNGVDEKFMGILIESNFYKNFIHTIAGGSAQPNANAKDLTSFKFRIPPLSTQQKIADILSAYDDLIENNNKRIALLEKAAEEIYREWFVRMRFPGWETVKFLKGIPEGWSIEKLDNLCKLIARGISPKYTESSEQLVINQKCIRDGKINLSVARRHDTSVPKEKFVCFGDVLINSTGVGTLGRISIVEFDKKNITCDSHVTICRADEKNINPHYLAHSVKRLADYFEYMAVGATGQVELNKGLISGTKILVPRRELQDKFSMVIINIGKQKDLLLSANIKLLATRELLLSRLISGKLSVDELDIRSPLNVEGDFLKG